MRTSRRTRLGRDISRLCRELGMSEAQARNLDSAEMLDPRRAAILRRIDDLQWLRGDSASTPPLGRRNDS